MPRSTIKAPVADAAGAFHVDQLTVPMRAVTNLVAMPTPLLRPLIQFIENDYRGRRARCLAEHPALAAHLAIAASFHPSAAFNARHELDCGHDLERVARTARFTVPKNADISKLRIEWRSRRPWVTTDVKMTRVQWPRPPTINVEEIAAALEETE